MKNISVDQLGNKLTRCSFNCEGVCNNPKLGIIPRCLILEKRKGKNNCIVVGLNPGKCNEKEREYYLQDNLKYSAIHKFFLENLLSKGRYFPRTKDVLNQLNFKGDILWTNLVKCECLDKKRTIPIQTLRVCINKFLRKEIDFYKCKTIFALGSDAFNFCALSFPNHFIIGIPHPSGSRNFISFRNKVFSNTRYFTKIIAIKKDGNKKIRAVHLARV